VKARFTPGAIADLDLAAAWYADNATPDVAQRFRQAARKAVERAERMPFAYARLPNQDGARRIIVHGFPYVVVFVVRVGVLRIVAFSHMKREPSYWRDRL